MTDYGYQVQIEDGYDEAVVRTRLALRAEGFSILTEMHVGGMLGPEAGEGRQYLFMGAWDADLDKKTDSGLRVALQLPCNVVVQETGSSALVAVLDPEDTMDTGDPDIGDAVKKATEAVQRVLDHIGSKP